MGHDFLFGGAGQDTLIGGTGADVFFFRVANEGADAVFDFNQSEGATLWRQSNGMGIGASAQRVNDVLP